MIDFGSSTLLYIYPAGLEYTNGVYASAAFTHAIVGYDAFIASNTGATAAEGYATDGQHVLIRFNSGTVIGDDLHTVCGGMINLEIDTTNATNTIGVDLWASEFGLLAGAVDYNAPTNNLSTGNRGAMGTLRARICQLVAPGPIVAGAIVNCSIPSRFIKTNPGGGGLGYSDFELRPSLVSGAYPAMATTDTVSFTGNTAGFGINRPYLKGFAFSDAELQSTDLSTILPYRFQGVGAETYVGFGIENQRGQAVMGRYLLDITSSTLDSYAENLMSQSLNKNRVRPRKMAIGRAGAGGNINFEITPDRWTRLLLGFMQVTNSITPPAAPTAALDVVAGVLSNAPITFTDLVGATASTVPVVTSASYSFVTADVGQYIRITAGTNWTLGTYQIIAVNVTTGAATLSAACASVASPTGGTYFKGGYTYQVVFAQDTTTGPTSLDSYPSTVSNGVVISVQGTAGKINLTNIPVSPSNQVVARKIYRSLVGGTDHYYVGIITDNVTTTYTDNIVDTSLALLIPQYNQSFNRIYFGPATSNQIQTFTFIQKTGFLKSVYPGCMLSSLALNLELDRIVTASVALDALTEIEYDVDAAGGVSDEFILEGGAAYDSVTNGDLSYVGGSVTIGGVTTGNLVQSFELNISQSTAQRRGLNRQRGPSSHYALGFVITCRFNLYFDNEVILRRSMGDVSRFYPFQVGRSIVFDQVQVYYAGVKDGDPNANQPACQRLTVTMPSMSYETVRKPVNSEAAIMLDVTGVAVWNDTLGTNFQLELLTDESPSDFVPSANPITVLPVGVPPALAVPSVI